MATNIKRLIARMIMMTTTLKDNDTYEGWEDSDDI